MMMRTRKRSSASVVSCACGVLGVEGILSQCTAFASDAFVWFRVVDTL